MGVPSAVKITKNSVTFTSSIDRVIYTMQELQRAALRDMGKLIRNRALDEVRKLQGFKRGKRPLKAFQIWVRKREGNLQVGIKHDTWYGVEQELGTSKQPRRAILTNAARNNISEMRRIAGLYLKHIEDENAARALIDENDEGLDENE